MLLGVAHLSPEAIEIMHGVYLPYEREEGTNTKTPKGYEIPIPKEEDFLRDLEKVSKPKKDSQANRPKK